MAGRWDDQDKAVEVWRCVVAVLAGDPAPAAAGDPRLSVIEAYARRKAEKLIRQVAELAPEVARISAERQLASLMLADLEHVPL